MRLKLLPVLLLLYSGNIFATYNFPVEIFEYIDNTKIVAFINKEDIDKTETWSPFSGTPPLTIAKALKHIKKTLTSDMKSKHISKIVIELKQIPNHKKHWYYLVKLAYEANNKQEFHYFVVLMNGKVIAALEEPESIK